MYPIEIVQGPGAKPRLLSRWLPLLVLASAPLGATTVVVPTDSRLVDRSDLVVVATVASKLPPPELERPLTDYWVEVEQILKGELDGSVLVLRSPGGLAGNGTELRLWGVPEFQPGERALLFLNRHRDGTWRIAHTVLGAFRPTRIGDREVAFRDLSDVDVLSSADASEADPTPSRRQRDFGQFTTWIADRAAGSQRGPDYFFYTPDASGNSILPMFTLLESDDGRPMRWFQFDSNGSVVWRIDPDPLGGFSGNATSSFQSALGAWNAESRTPIRYNFGGTSTATTGFQSNDGVNVLLFDDPNNDVDETFSCSEGGTLAVGGPWFSVRNTGRFNNETFLRIQEADIVLNDGLECFFQRSGTAVAAELFGHELGHTLGLGHSSESANETNATLRDALMYFRVHNDGRGASLRSDDLAGIRRLYQPGSGGGGGGNNNCPADTLCLQRGRFQVTATWENQFDGSSGVAGTIPGTDLSGYLYFTDRNNIELIAKTLDFGDRFLFFYGQLTNLRFRIRVLDTTNGREKFYVNTAGDCGGIDNSLATASGVFLDAGEGELAEFAACQSDVNNVCLLNGRFRLDLDWRNQFDGSSGRGLGQRLSDLTAAFAFTDPANLEILVKTLDFGDRVLVLYGVLSNLEYTLRVTEVATGRVKSYHNPPGNYCGGLDNNAF